VVETALAVEIARAAVRPELVDLERGRDVDQRLAIGAFAVEILK
jgi:hypothetical protein